MANTTATIGGRRIIGAVSWSQTSGTAPFQTTFEMKAEEAQALFDSSSLVDLIIKVGDASPAVTVKGLYILEIAPTDSPFKRRVLVSDKRWLWSRKYVFRRYNVRRRTGDKQRLHDAFLESIGSMDVIDSVAYLQWSTRDGSPWKPEEILLDVMSGVESDKPTVSGVPDSIPIDNMELDDTGDAAIARVLQNIPGLSVTVDVDGKTRFYNQLDGSEAALLKLGSAKAGLPGGSGPPTGNNPPVFMDEGWTLIADHRKTRPRAINVYFTREIEIRMDFWVGSGTVTMPPLGFTLQNVLPVPDKILQVGGVNKYQGTYDAMGDVIAAWNADGIPTGAEPLTGDLINGSWLSGGLIPMYVHQSQAGAAVGVLSEQEKWTMRIAALMSSYRMLFRISREVMDRIISLRANRVSVIDPSRGTQSPSPCYTNYYLLMDLQRALLDDENQGHVNQGFNVRGYNASTAKCQAAPVDVMVIDEETGIVQLSFRKDTFAQIVDYIPGIVQNEPWVSMKMEGGKPRFKTEKRPDSKEAILDSDHGVAIILTCAVAAPNSLSNLEKVTVTPSDVAKWFPGVSLSAEGPELNIRVGPSITTAKYSWQDDAANAIKEVMGFDTSGVDTDRPRKSMNDIWINRDRECVPIAQAFAASEYSATIDKWTGTRTGILNGEIKMTGSIDNLTHSLRSNGVASTSVSAPSTSPRRKSFMSFLPASLRRTLLTRGVQP